MNYTLNGCKEILQTEGINSKQVLLKAFKQASSTDLIGFRNDLNKYIAIKIIKERKEGIK